MTCTGSPTPCFGQLMTVVCKPDLEAWTGTSRVGARTCHRQHRKHRLGFGLEDAFSVTLNCVVQCGAATAAPICSVSLFWWYCSWQV